MTTYGSLNVNNILFQNTGVVFVKATATANTLTLEGSASTTAVELGGVSSISFLESGTANTISLDCPTGVTSYSIQLPPVTATTNGYTLKVASGGGTSSLVMEWGSGGSGTSIVSWKDPVIALENVSNYNIASGTTPIDGVALTALDRILLNAQTDPAENGLWIYNGVGAALTRPTDFTTGYSAAGTACFVLEGTQYGDTAWVCTTDPPNDIVDTNNLSFSMFGQTPNASGDTGDIQIKSSGGGFTSSTALGDETVFNYSISGGDGILHVGAGAASVNPNPLFVIQSSDAIGATGDGSGIYIQLGSSASGATGDGGSFSVFGGNAISTNGTGGSVQFYGGAGVGSGDGGLLYAISGTGGATGNGGSFGIVTGDGGSTSGNGGAIGILCGGSGSANGDGGGLVLSTGAGTGSGNGGDVTMSCGSTSGSGDGGDIGITAGGSDSGNGGVVNIYCGNSVSGTSGHITLNGGDTTSTNVGVYFRDNSANNVMYVLSGTQNATSTSTGTLRVVGGMSCTQDAYATSFNAVSDIRLKENIEQLRDSLGIVLGMNGYRYNFIDDKKQQLGLVAQELEHIPGIVSGDDNVRCINYNAIIPLLVEAIKELNQKIDSHVE